MRVDLVAQGDPNPDARHHLVPSVHETARPANRAGISNTPGPCSSGCPVLSGVHERGAPAYPHPTLLVCPQTTAHWIRDAQTGVPYMPGPACGARPTMRAMHQRAGASA